MTIDYSTGCESGARGEPFRQSGAQEYAGWAAGKTRWDARQPQTSVDGVSFTALICPQLVSRCARIRSRRANNNEVAQYGSIGTYFTG